MFKSNKQRIHELKELVENHDILAGSMLGSQWDITEDFKWLINKTESLQKQFDAKITFINNGWEEERYFLQNKVERYEKAIIVAINSTSDDDIHEFLNRLLQGKEDKAPHYRLNVSDNQKVNPESNVVYLVTNGNFLEGYYKSKDKAQDAVLKNNNAAKDLVAMGIKHVDTKPCYIEEIELAD